VRSAAGVSARRRRRGPKGQRKAAGAPARHGLLVASQLRADVAPFYSQRRYRTALWHGRRPAPAWRAERALEDVVKVLTSRRHKADGTRQTAQGRRHKADGTGRTAQTAQTALGKTALDGARQDGAGLAGRRKDHLRLGIEPARFELVKTGTCPVPSEATC
jgi:hypothetical protein